MRLVDDRGHMGLVWCQFVKCRLAFLWIYLGSCQRTLRLSDRGICLSRGHAGVIKENKDLNEVEKSQMMNILVMGINHTTAPMEIREKFYFAQAKQELCISEMKNHPLLVEGMVLST